MTLIESLRETCRPAGDHPLRIVLIGDGEALPSLLAEAFGDMGLIRHVTGTRRATRDDGREGAPARPPGAASLAYADLPRLTDVAAFYEGVPGGRATVAAYADTLRRAAMAAEDDGLRPSRVASGEADLVVVSDEPIAAGHILRKLAGAKLFLLIGDKASFGWKIALESTTASGNHRLVAGGAREDGDWALIQRTDQSLVVNFITVLHETLPFIGYHQSVLETLPFAWHWHIVEAPQPVERKTFGLAAIRAYLGGASIGDDIGKVATRLANAFPDKVTRYRHGADGPSTDQASMLNRPLAVIDDECLVWRLEADELWTAAQIEAVRKAFEQEQERSAAAFWRNTYVAPGKGIATRYDRQPVSSPSALRVWRFTPGMAWSGVDEPILLGQDVDGSYDVGRRHAFSCYEMEAIGAVVEHFAVVTAEQARAWGTSSGCADAVDRWRALAASPATSARLRDHLPCIATDAMVDTIERLGWVPPAWLDEASGTWRYRSPADLATMRADRRASIRALVVVDGVFFQLSTRGIGRLWANLLMAWASSGFGEQVVLLDRGGTAPRLPGVRYHSIQRHEWSTIDGDAIYLQEVCDRLGATLFLSTYYTTPTRTPTVFCGYDMIPEAFGSDLDDVWWRQKRRAVQHAAGHIMISHSSARELVRHFPFVKEADVLVAHCSAEPIFAPADPDAIAAFRDAFDLERDYVMLVGDRVGWRGYKNATVVFAALAQMSTAERPLLVCVGGAPELEKVGSLLLGDGDVAMLQLEDADLRLCYAGALAYICPSLMEGFGIPIVEAMAVGTPVLVCANTSIPEVAGEAGVYFDARDPGSLVKAIEAVRHAETRRLAIAAGLNQAATFDQARTARLIAGFCGAVIERVGPCASERDRGVLADAFRDAEDRRRATAASRAVQQQMFRAKTALAQAARLVREAASDVGNVLWTDAVGQGLDSAYALLDGKPGGTDDARMGAEGGSSALGPDIIDFVGLSREEGPFPDAGMFSSFRWQVSSTSVITCRAPASGSYWVEVEFGNIEREQCITLSVDGQPMCAFRPTKLSWRHVWCIRVPINVDQDRVDIGLEANAFASSPADNRLLYIAVYGVRLVRKEARAGDAPEVVDLSATGSADATGRLSLAELPGALALTSGVGKLEGPYPSVNIPDMFRWQTAERCEFHYILQSPATAWLQLTLGNVEPGQVVRVWQGDTLLTMFEPALIGWEHRWRLRLPILLDQGKTAFYLDASCYHLESVSQRKMYLGIFGLHLLPRIARAGQIAEIDDVHAAPSSEPGQ